MNRVRPRDLEAVFDAIGDATRPAWPGASAPSRYLGPRSHLVAFATSSYYLLFAGMSKTAPPSEQEVDRLRLLVQTFVRNFGLLVTKETPCGQPVSPSYAHALMLLLERTRKAGRTSQADLASVLGIDKSNVARLCARMEESGHVVQEASPDDGRSRLLRLTHAGTKLARGIERASRERFRRVAGGVASEERPGLLHALTLLNIAVAALGDEKEPA